MNETYMKDTLRSIFYR